MTTETHVTVRLSSTALFDALRHEVGEWRLDEHTFDPGADELQVVYDADGSGRIGMTVVFELDEAQMARVLRRATSTDRPGAR